MSRNKKAVPDNWLDYTRIGKPIPGTRIVCFKVPLKEELSRSLDHGQRFTPDMLMESMPDLVGVIDITNTPRYYNNQEFIQRGIKHEKVQSPGHVVPPNNVVQKFKGVMDNFWKLADSSGKYVGVHCTHGVNRTGYLVCRYLIECRGFNPEEAIKLFGESRGHPIERKNYLDNLMSLKCNSSLGQPSNNQMNSPPLMPRGESKEASDGQLGGQSPSNVVGGRGGGMMAQPQRPRVSRGGIRGVTRERGSGRGVSENQMNSPPLMPRGESKEASDGQLGGQSPSNVVGGRGGGTMAQPQRPRVSRGGIRGVTRERGSGRGVSEVSGNSSQSGSSPWLGNNSGNWNMSSDGVRRSGSIQQYSDSQQLFMGNLPLHAGENDLRELFGKFGTILELRIHSKQNTKGPSGKYVPNYGFIVFKDPASVQEVLGKKPIYFPGDGGQKLNLEEKKNRQRSENQMNSPPLMPRGESKEASDGQLGGQSPSNVVGGRGGGTMAQPQRPRLSRGGIRGVTREHGSGRGVSEVSGNSSQSGSSPWLGNNSGNWNMSSDGDRRRSGRIQQYSDSQQLFMGNLPLHAGENDLREMFGKFGTILELRIHSKQNTKGPSGKYVPNYGFIVFKDPASVQEVLGKKPIYFPGDGGQKLNLEEKKNRQRSEAGGVNNRMGSGDTMGRGGTQCMRGSGMISMPHGRGGGMGGGGGPSSFSRGEGGRGMNRGYTHR